MKKYLFSFKKFLAEEHAGMGHAVIGGGLAVLGVSIYFGLELLSNAIEEAVNVLEKGIDVNVNLDNESLKALDKVNSNLEKIVEKGIEMNMSLNNETLSILENLDIEYNMTIDFQEPEGYLSEAEKLLQKKYR